ncbi:MAG TPA: sugar ABC transporter ATP-binding protein, partial [Cyanobacteria bacterium UBA11049]|nr:sugar ABC transporter ATP-binding protein [Cyanobacteria bacterium UBA11049]
YLSVIPVGATNTATKPLQVRIPPDRFASIGEQLWLAIAPDKIHLFDPDTSMAIRHSIDY